jgi:3-dehydroquinate synthase
MKLEFSVNTTSFTGELEEQDVSSIKSFNKDYQVLYSHKNLDKLISEVYEIQDFIFIDRNVYNLSPETFVALMDNIFIFDATEDNKTIDSSLALIDVLYNKKFTKKNKLIVVGGGITQDVGGFASAIYKRGLNWVFIPTTILSMTDSCIGGKVAINRGSKNMLGLFVAPNKIYISDYFIESLKEDDVMSGLGESLKLSLTGGMNAYEYFKKNLETSNYINIIKMSSSVKKIVVQHDEFEKDERRVLNYGHTFGHAIESTTNYFIPHGIAVLIGMYIKNKMFYNDKYEEINNIILKLVNKKFFDIAFNYNVFINHVLSDKKNQGNNICFILLDEIGKSIFIFKPLNEVEQKIKDVLNELFGDKMIYA